MLNSLFDYTANEETIRTSEMEMQEWVKGECGTFDIDLIIIPPLTKAYWLNHQLNVLDTPSERDFEGRLERSLRVMDGGLFCFSAVD
ncbi:MAG TPA: hypothetical protein ENK90_02180, partial [Epsilonproteobacteria bacterium]|nr:hypothetical protein [Campylobacterota bacterium]